METIDLMQNKHLLHKYEGFKPDRVARFAVVTNHFEEDCLHHVLVFKNSQRMVYLYAVYQHKELNPCKHYLIWYKEDLSEGKTWIDRLFGGRNAEDFGLVLSTNKPIDWLFESTNYNEDMKLFSSLMDWMAFKRLNTNTLDWVDWFQCCCLL